MRLFVAVLLLWSITQGLDQRGDALPSLVLWAIWSAALLGCAAAAWADVYLSLSARVTGLISYVMIILYYITQQSVYLAFMPADPAYPDMWATLYLVINLVAPIGLVTIGIARVAIQREET